MPVSHLGLTVSRIPEATSFYLAALQPLRYQYIGTQGDSIGLGIIDADFFLCQQPNGARVTPTHVAFAANDRLAVRNCYAAALNAGGRPSGAPGYQNPDCSCFNAAVTDLDGHTLEFIFKEQTTSTCDNQSCAPSQLTKVPSQPISEARSVATNGTQSMRSTSSRARSRWQTALDAASATSKQLKQPEASARGLARSQTEPVNATQSNGGTAVVGTLLGAAAGAALTYAMCQSERDSTREEAAFASATRSRASSNKSGKSSSSASKSSALKGHGSIRQPPRSVRAIQAPQYDDTTVQDAISQYKSSQRPMPQRSRTYDAIEYAQRPSGSRHDAKRSSTLPLEMPTHYYLEAPRSVPASHQSSRRGSTDDRNLKRHDSGVSMGSHHSQHRSSMSKASNVKPSRRDSLHESVANVPLPGSRATSRYTAAQHRSQASPSKAPSYYSAAQMPLPCSRPTSYVSAAQVPMPPSYTAGGYTHDPEESDGLSDIKTVVPDDSISCVDFSKPTRKPKSSIKSSRHSSKRSEAEKSDRTVRPAKQSSSRHSAMTLPVRSKDERYGQNGSKRSTHTYV